MNCKNCGAELRPDAKFCENCGTKVEVIKEKEENKENINPDEQNDYGFVREGSERVPPVQPPYGNNNQQPYGYNQQPYGNNAQQPYGYNQPPYGYNPQQPPYGNNNQQRPYAVYPGGNTPQKKKSHKGIIALVLILVLGLILGGIVIAIVVTREVFDDVIYDDNIIYDDIYDNILDDEEVYFPEDEADDYPDYSTYELPSFDDFSWYYEIEENGIWDGAEELVDFYRIDGSWKGMIIYDVNNPQGKEIMNVGISGDAIDTVLNFDWYKIMWNGEAPGDKTDDEDTVLYGGYDEDEDCLLFEYGFTVLMRDFYEYDGAQYGICEFIGEDGTESVILLTRP